MQVCSCAPVLDAPLYSTKQQLQKGAARGGLGKPRSGTLTTTLQGVLVLVQKREVPVVSCEDKLCQSVGSKLIKNCPDAAG